MNKPISRLFVVVIVLFALLIVWTSRWTVFDQSALASNPLNRLNFFQTEQIKRGRILADDGTVLASSVKARNGLWDRTYPTNSLTSQIVGYNNITEGQSAGLEQSWVTQLQARQQTQLSSVFGPISQSDVGNDVDTTVDPKAQALAKQLLAGRIGSVVAIVPQSGDIVTMYSNPTYDNNQGAKATCAPAPSWYSQDACQLNLATQGLFPPGSTFKVVTSAAALDTGAYTPNSLIDGHSPIKVSGTDLQNDDNEQFGDITLTEALTQSVNTVYAQVGLKLGANVLDEYMKRFGFYAQPPVDLPASSFLYSGERINGKLVPVTNPNIDLGRTAIGQANLLVSPLQMAMVASTIADRGTLMTPHFATKVVNPDGQIVQTINPSVDNHVMKASSAAELKQMMTDVVEEGTGQSANLEGLKVAGKTGTASITALGVEPPLDDAWFIGLAPVDNPKIAVAVVLPHIANGYGGTYAAPVAAQMMKELLAEGL